ncbi:MAG: glycosyltransferase [Psychroserpens sp.]|uniref:glycosyltransferase n=1 Tax=Psychroserpens sp. TaxID=2020870 RepID=UPI003002C3C7
MVPTYNSYEQLKTCVLSIKNQSFKNYEILIIDGQSTDDTKQLLQTLKPPFFWKTEKDEGVYDAMNKGIEQAQGSWLYFMGSDDQFFETNVLDSVFQKPIDKNIELIIGSIKYDCESKASRYLNKDHGVRKTKWSFNLWVTNSVHHQGVFYKRSVFNEMRYNLKYKILSDYDVNLKLFRKKKKAKMIDDVISFCGAEGLSKNYSWSMYKEEIQLKTTQSFILLKPVFYVLAMLKYLFKIFQK